jgi:hypothetical protein
VPSLIPKSRATCAIGLPVSRTIRTAPSRNSRSNRLLVSAMTIYPLRSGLHANGGTSELSSPASMERLSFSRFGGASPATAER